MNKLTHFSLIIILISNFVFSQNKDSISLKQKIISPSAGLFSSTEGKYKLSFVGTGDVQKSLNEGDELAANTGVGVIIKRKWDNKEKLISDYKFGLSINVASTVDTIKVERNNMNKITNVRDFGTSILLPKNSGQATKINFNLNFTERKLRILSKNSKTKNKFYLTDLINGMNFEFVSSNRVWSDTTDYKYATTVMLKTGFYHDFIRNDIRLEKGYSVRAGLSYTFRGIFGDAGFNNDSSQEFRNKLLGTETRKFHGFEIDLSFRLKNIEATVSIPHLYASGADSILGLSKTQFITSIGFVGGFPVSLKKKESNDDDWDKWD